MQLSLAITTYNRTADLEQIMTTVCDHQKLSEIIISDDASTPEIQNEISLICKRIPKAHIYFHESNVGAFANKLRAVSYCKNDHVILLDSDNSIDNNYIDKCLHQNLNKNTIYAPTFAKPNFGFPGLYDVLFASNDDLKHCINTLELQIALNTGNYLVPKNEYIRVAAKYVDIIYYCEVMHFAYVWIKERNCIQFVQGLEYNHKVHNGFYMMHKAKHDEQSKKLVQMILSD